jgi:hypothetical protein
VLHIAAALKREQTRRDYDPDADAGIPEEPTRACETVARFVQVRPLCGW